MSAPGARVHADTVVHNEAATGFLAGSLIGGFLATEAAVLTEGAVTALAIAAGVATGGLGFLAVEAVGFVAGVAIGALVCGKCQSIGQSVGQSIPSGSASPITTGSANVFINGEPAAFVTSLVACHSGEAIAEGSGTVSINGKPAARIGSRTTQNATVVSGSPNVLIGGPSQVAAEIRPFGWGVELLGAALAMVGGFGRALLPSSAERSAMNALRSEPETVPGEGETGGRTGESTETAPSTGHPVNPATGAVWTEQTDFVTPGPLPTVFSRHWNSSSTIVGELGRGWQHSFDMAIWPVDGRWTLRLADGRLFIFDAPSVDDPSRNIVERIELHTDGQQLWARSYDGLRFGFGPPSGPSRIRHLIRVTDGNDNAIGVLRDPDGGLLAILDSAGRRLQVHRDPAGRIVAIDGPDPVGAGTLTLVRYAYDGAGRLVHTTDAAGGAFDYAYDQRHLLKQERRPAGLVFHFSYDEAKRCVSTWGDDGLYERHLAYEEHTTTVRHGSGATEQFDHNARGRVVAHTDPLGRRMTREYLADILLVAETRADGATHSVRHDAFGRVVESFGFDGTRRQVAYAPTRPADAVTALPVAVTGPDGAVERFEWDLRGNLARHVDATGRTRSFLRDARGLPLAVQDGLGVARRFGWTARGELAWEAAASGVRVAFSYDELGHLSSRQRADEAPTHYRHDPLGRLVEIRRPDGAVRLTRNEEGRVTSHHDAAGHITRWTYDGLPAPTRRINADGTGLLYRYDADLNLVALSNEKGEPYALRYDLGGQLVEEVGFDGRRRTYDYDAAGFLASHGDEEGRGATYRRDPMGRLLERRHTDGAVESYAYDPRGALTRAANAHANIEFRYAADGRLEEERSGDLPTSHRYDGRGRRIATTLPDGRLIQTAYDETGYVRGIGFEGVTVAVFRRDALGRERVRLAGGITTQSDYDPQGRLTRQSGRRREGSQPVLERTYGWDEADRLTETHDLARGLRRYRYDPRERLLAVDALDADSEQFVTDPAGNILGAPGEASGGAAIGDRLLIRGDRKFEYDGCGNRVREVRGAGGGVERLYRYNTGNQLTEVEERSRLGRRVTRFAYDALGRRTEKHSAWWPLHPANDATDAARAAPTTTTRFLWSGDVLLAESATADPLATVYLHEPSSFRPLAQVRRSSPDVKGEVYHYHLDHLGTPLEVTNDTGGIVWQGTMKAWGALARATVAEIAQPIRFQGQYHDAETGLYYNRFRYYSPDEGCFVHQDPIGLLGGTNPGAYVSAPTLWVDPFGLAPCAFVDDDGVLNLKNKYEPGSTEDLALQQHVSDWNSQIESSGGTMTRQSVTPDMRLSADQAARDARLGDPASYPSGTAPGHTPDVGWGGDPAGPINPVNSRVNSYVGGATQAVPVGTPYSRVVLVR